MKIAVYAISKNEAQFVERFCQSAKDAALEAQNTDNPQQGETP